MPRIIFIFCRQTLTEEVQHVKMMHTCFLGVEDNDTPSMSVWSSWISLFDEGGSCCRELSFGAPCSWHPRGVYCPFATWVWVEALVEKDDPSEEGSISAKTWSDSWFQINPLDSGLYYKSASWEDDHLSSGVAKVGPYWSISDDSIWTLVARKQVWSSIQMVLCSAQA